MRTVFLLFACFFMLSDRCVGNLDSSCFTPGAFHNSDDDPSLYVIGGERFKARTYPSLVLVFNIFGPFCTGALIGDTWVLTAAHCFRTTSATQVWTGVSRLGKAYSGEDECVEKISVESVIINQKFLGASSDFENDIALIKLRQPSEYTPAILDTHPAGAYTGNYTLAGWAGEPETLLQELPLRAEFPQSDQCSKIEFESGRIFTPATKICIGGTGEASACFGDSGGPIYKTEQSTVISGGVSYGYSVTCTLTDPFVNFRVFAYLDWICENTNGEVCALVPPSSPPSPPSPPPSPPFPPSPPAPPPPPRSPP